MIRIASILALAALLFATVAAPPEAAFAADDSQPHMAVTGDAQEEAGEDDAWGFTEAVIWTIAGLAVFAAIMGALYYFKRQVGGFPEHPSWVAPITIMRSKDFPDEEDFGGQAPSGQAHAEH